MKIHKLEGWMTVPEAALYIGISKQGVHKMIFEQNLFKEDEVCSIGSKPIYLVDTNAVEVIKQTRDQLLKDRKDAQELAEKLTEIKMQLTGS